MEHEIARTKRINDNIKLFIICHSVTQNLTLGTKFDKSLLFTEKTQELHWNNTVYRSMYIRSQSQNYINLSDVRNIKNTNPY
jgi:hypothetical protein